MIRWIDRYFFKAVIAFGLALLVFAIYQFIQSLPPRTFTILTGREGGGYYQAAQAYQKIAKEKGFNLVIRPTAGSVEALDLLEKGEAGIGFVQGGVAVDADQSVLTSMASVYYEPVWVVLRTASFDDPLPKRLTALAGKNIGIGEDGSGAQLLALQLLNASGVTGTMANLVAGSSSEMIDQLESGELDAAFFVTTLGSETGQRLLGTKGLYVMDMEQAEAYASLFRFLRVVTIPQGGFDLAKNLPIEDKRLLATTANLIVRKDFHPDLLRLMTIAAVETHSKGGFFEARDEFPTTQYADLPTDRRGRAYLERIKNGESTVDNYLPFSFAAVADRYMLFILPLVFLFLPIVSRAPLIYVLWNRFKVNRWYKVAAKIERQLPGMNLAEVQRQIAYLESVDDELMDLTNLPTGQLVNVYQLHEHIELLIRKLQRREQILLGQTPVPEPVP